MARWTESSAVNMYGVDATALTTMNYLRKEVVRKSRELVTLKYTSADENIYESTITPLEQFVENKWRKGRDTYYIELSDAVRTK